MVPVTSPRHLGSPALACWAALGLITIPLAAWILGPIMHETDQASLLSGAWQLAHGQTSALNAPFYNYDKQSLTYLWVALWLKLFPQLDPVGLGNLSTFLIFWTAAAILLLRHPPRTWPSAAAAVAIILAPAFWQHSAFLASNFLSAALLILGFSLWHPGRLHRKILTLLFWSGAVLARADALALLPVLIWSQLPARGWLKNRWLWATAAAGLAAFLVGRSMASSVPEGYPAFFNGKIYAAYLVFGLGAAALVLAHWTFQWIGISLTVRRSRTWHALAGAAGLLPIFTFYSFQMFSTRHWVALLAGLLILALSRRAAIIFHSKAMAIATLAAALLPTVIGLQLFSLREARVAFGPGTAFPSADGNLTMGGYLPQLIEMKRSDFSHDHNHPLWLAIKGADFQPNADGRIPLLGSPMIAYYEFACRLRGLLPTEMPDTSDRFYVDSRTVLREVPALNPASAFSTGNLARTHRLLPASKSVQGYRMLEALPGSPTPEMVQLLRLAEQFRGDEFRILPSPTAARAARWRGHRIVLVTGDRLEELTFDSLPDEAGLAKVDQAAVSLLPAFMSVQPANVSPPPAK